MRGIGPNRKKEMVGVQRIYLPRLLFLPIRQKRKRAGPFLVSGQTLLNKQLLPLHVPAKEIPPAINLRPIEIAVLASVGPPGVPVIDVQLEGQDPIGVTRVI